ncbi:tRNA (adenosine(37)-N6)-threonylcarbamoyltransferase complex transferase subunit TsaD [Rickettsiella grylli]|uniref:tRNA (adenosine(37)-N6)-threonylcarbamoyltransferase complex transferase subunit TsaD n=1 Tax=Rickettsiella grylli TaxID=59196 RepID=UPI0008FD1658|nr:tRNA (adenosine(37)-N6)-threonylcarbamoyltransferase complex transferase subunit TsaD [Rickettsiella grylli]OIZ99072.1 tRNA (adenosine(37)-N6)-threonylcarbamoyltransferase complex transferase subunit TsaD [Rickettsiella grylli]
MQSFYSKKTHCQPQKIACVLGIETSCDETGIALYHGQKGLLAHTLYSQIELHNRYGGVVPELASRDHILKILPLLQETLSAAHLSLSAINGIAYCSGPGLTGALLVGATFGRSLGWALGIPSLGVHHMEAHLLAPMLDDPMPEFPFLALLVSGGHTLLAEVTHIGRYKILGVSLDDAAGEAFDKTAQLLGLAYPGGPAIAAFAEKGKSKQYQFPRPMLNRPDCHFSFSGLKTFVNTTFKNSDKTDQTKANIAYEFQSAVVDTLVAKTARALNQTGLGRLVVAGGVAANTQLRKALKTLAIQQNVSLYYPQSRFCTDNGAMIAYLGYRRLNLGQYDNDLTIRTIARYPLDQLD